MSANPEVVRRALSEELYSSGSNSPVRIAGHRTLSGYFAFDLSGESPAWGCYRLAHSMRPVAGGVMLKLPATDPLDIGASDLFEEALEWLASEPDFTVEGFHRAYGNR